MIELEIDGSRFAGWTTATVSRSIDAVSGRFSFEARGLNEANPFAAGQAVTVLTDDTLFLTGFIESVIINYSADNHVIRLSGRSNTADLIDSTLDGSIELNENITLEQAIQKVLDFTGFKAKILNNVGPLDSLKFEDTPFSSEVGQTQFAVIEQYARKAKVLVTQDAEGNIVLTRGGEERVPRGLLHEIDNNANNVLNAEVSVNIVDRFSKYTYHSVGNPSSISKVSSFFSANEETTNEEISNRDNFELDDQIRDTRIFNQQAENSSEVADLKERAIWETNIRRARSISYNYTVTGHSIDGQIFEPNKIIKVKDDFAGITDSDLLIRNVTFQQSIDGGNTTSLNLIQPDAFRLQAERPQKDQKDSPTAEGAFSVFAQ